VRPPDKTFQAEQRGVDGHQWVIVTGEIDMTVEAEFRKAIHGDPVFIDLADVTFMDSTGIRVLLEARQQRDVLVGPRSREVDRLFELAGLSDMFTWTGPGT
jgi:anti-anti-sigma factor